MDDQRAGDGLEVVLLDARRDPAPAGWDAFVDRGRLARTWRWEVVRALALGGRGEYRVAMVSDSGAVVGLVAYLRRAVGVLQVQAPGSSALPGIAMAGDRDGELGSGPVDVALGRAVVRAWECSVRRHHRTVAVVWYRQVYGNLLPVLLDRAAMSAPGWPVAWFHNTFDDYDGYLASLPKSRRVDQRRLVRRIDEDPELTVSWGPGAGSSDLDQLHTLVEGTAARYQTRRVLAPRSLSRSLVDTVVAGPDSMLLRYSRGDALIGVGLTIDHPTAPIASVWGAHEPKDGGRNGLWFDQTARVLQWVIGSGREGIIGGKGLVDLKVRLGYRAVPQWSVARRLRS